MPTYEAQTYFHPAHHLKLTMLNKESENLGPSLGGRSASSGWGGLWLGGGGGSFSLLTPSVCASDQYLSYMQIAEQAALSLI